MNKKILIEITNEENAKVSINNGKSNTVKTIPLDTLSSVFARRSDTFNTGIMPPNVINYVKSGNINIYHIFAPGHTLMMKNSRIFRSCVGAENATLEVRVPSTIFSFYAKDGSRNLNSQCIHVLDTDIWNPNSPLWGLKMSNYSDSYGICWGDSQNMIEGIVESRDLLKISSLPHMFWNSVFNVDLFRTYNYKSSFAKGYDEWLSPMIADDSHLKDHNLYTGLIMRYMQEKNFSWNMSMMVDDKPSHPSITSFIENYNTSIINAKSE